MTYTPQTVISYGFPFDDFAFTYNLANGITTDNVGQALTLDSSGASKFKLAGDGAAIQGRLVQVENRDVSGMLVGTVARKFKEPLPTDGSAVAVGDAVCGSATAGKVRKAVAGTDPITNLVVEVLSDGRVVVESL